MTDIWKAKELRGLTEQELLAREEDCRKQVYLLRQEREKTKKLENPQQSRLVRKNRARALTVLREKQLAEQQLAKG